MDRLTELLIKVLPDKAEEAIRGSDLIARLRQEGLSEEEWSDNSLRSRFSQLVSNTSSVIVRRPGKQGYYRRVEVADVADEVTQSSKGKKKEVVPREGQAEEKFRSIYMAWARSENEYPVHIEHTEGKGRRAGINIWKFPDVVSVAWDVLQLDSGNREYYLLDGDVLNVRRSLGEQPFKLVSTELKVGVTSIRLREVFFQCVSNSRWAHSSRLAVAMDLEDEVLVKELQRLGASYGVSILTFSLSQAELQKLPSASQMGALQDIEKALGRELIVTTLSAPAERDIVDWEHIKDMQVQHDDFRRIFQWVSKCINDAIAWPYEMWKRNLARSTNA